MQPSGWTQIWVGTGVGVMSLGGIPYLDLDPITKFGGVGVGLTIILVALLRHFVIARRPRMVLLVAILIGGVVGGSLGAAFGWLLLRATQATQAPLPTVPFVFEFPHQAASVPLNGPALSTWRIPILVNQSYPQSIQRATVRVRIENAAEFGHDPVQRLLWVKTIGHTEMLDLDPGGRYWVDLVARLDDGLRHWDAVILEPTTLHDQSENVRLPAGHDYRMRLEIFSKERLFWEGPMFLVHVPPVGQSNTLFTIELADETGGNVHPQG